MKTRIVFVICFGLAAVVSASAQGRAITNLDLENYRQARLNAEKELRENYTQLGFASPEERARLNAVGDQERLELAARLRSERIERERVEAQIEDSRTQQASYDALMRAMSYSQQQNQQTQQSSPTYYDYGYPGYGYPGYGYPGYGYPGYGRGGIWNGPTWRANGGGIIFQGGQPGWTPIIPGFPGKPRK